MRGFVAIGIVAVALLTGCSESTEDPGAPASESEVATPNGGDPSGASTSAPPLTASTEQYEDFSAEAEARGVLVTIPEDEMLQAATNICDNTLEEMVFLVDLLRVTYADDADELDDLFVERAVIVDVYCPGVRQTFDEATQQVIGRTIE